jgi:hypothetical protein
MTLVIFALHMLAGYSGASLISHPNDAIAHTYPFVDGPTLEERRSGRWSCRNCSYMQMVSRSRRGSRPACAAEDNKGASRTRRQDFDLRAQCPSAVPNRGRSRLRARFGGTTAQAPRFGCHSTRPPLGRAKSPKGSPERVLEAQRLISSRRFAIVFGELDPETLLRVGDPLHGGHGHLELPIAKSADSDSGDRAHPFDL